jgi:hypothetical protein
MNEINIKITYGIHILLDMHHILKSILNNYSSKINIELDIENLKKNRDDIDEKYLEKYLILAREILNIENVNITLNKNYKYVDFITSFCEILDTDKIYIKKNNYFTQYKLYNINILKPYICINTKIVNSSKYFNHNKNSTYNFIEKYNIIKNELFNVFNNLNYNIVILGERKIPNCNEYNFHLDNFGNYIMYNDFINNLNNIIDESYDDSKDGYDLDNWKKTCYYLKNSNLNIYIGNGGGIHLYSNFENTIHFGVKDRLLEWIKPENMETNLYSTIDSEDFINKIKLMII